MIFWISLFVWLLGLVIYFVSSNGKAMEMARIMFAVGLLVFLLCFPNGHFSLR